MTHRSVSSRSALPAARASPRSGHEAIRENPGDWQKLILSSLVELDRPYGCRQVRDDRDGHVHDAVAVAVEQVAWTDLEAADGDRLGDLHNPHEACETQIVVEKA